MSHHGRGSYSHGSSYHQIPHDHYHGGYDRGYYTTGIGALSLATLPLLTGFALGSTVSNTQPNTVIYTNTPPVNPVMVIPTNSQQVNQVAQMYPGYNVYYVPKV